MKIEANIPVVDFEKLPEEEERNKLKEACEKSGCFRIMNHPIEMTLMMDMKMVAKYLFDLPTEIKRRNKAVVPTSGYRSSTVTSPLYEGLGIYDMYSSPQAVENFCSEMNVSPHCREIIEAYGQAIHNLASRISQKMAESVGVAGADFKDWPFIFRIIKYNFTQETIGKLGVQPHSDTGFITLLQDDDTVSGLELIDDSGSFMEVPPKSGSLICIIGDVGHTLIPSHKWCTIPELSWPKLAQRTFESLFEARIIVRG
ncbi:hypothetical protein VNO77_35073 [Canavalia gladiata]|uniref:Uncharacterized protein n=1 Tax=Canavalia gladiata TaxID=3824 RepID=A0AAN9Q248_CANGL